jgi:hypothetical protein
VTDQGGHCSFCGATSGPFAKVEGLFTVWICIPCLEVRQAQPATRLGRHDPWPLSADDPGADAGEFGVAAQLGTGPEGGRQPTGYRRHPPAAGEQVARMYQEPGLAWLEGQAEAAEELLAERQAGDHNR